jgi:hypothetical protein
MKIAYKKRRIRASLFVALLWISWIVIEIFAFDLLSNRIEFIGDLLILMPFFVMYFYQMYYNYLTIENDQINVGGPLGKSLVCSEVTQIRKYAGDYFLKAGNKELKISSQMMDADSIPLVEDELKKLNAEWSYSGVFAN